MAEPNLIGGVTGGVLIGMAAALLLAVSGRIAGISGILGGLLHTVEPVERWWRLAFLVGLVAGAAFYSSVRGSLPLHLQATTPMLVIAGFLVGFGTRLGSGCTSGHGVCGLARLSPRSVVATLTFIIFGIVTVFFTRHLF